MFFFVPCSPGGQWFGVSKHNLVGNNSTQRYLYRKGTGTRPCLASWPPPPSPKLLSISQSVKLLKGLVYSILKRFPLTFGSTPPFTHYLKKKKKLNKFPFLTKTVICFPSNNTCYLPFLTSLFSSNTTCPVNLQYSLGQKFRIFKWDFISSLPGGAR